MWLISLMLMQESPSIGSSPQISLTSNSSSRSITPRLDSDTSIWWGSSFLIFTLEFVLSFQVAWLSDFWHRSVQIQIKPIFMFLENFSSNKTVDCDWGQRRPISNNKIVIFGEVGSPIQSCTAKADNLASASDLMFLRKHLWYRNPEHCNICI